MERALINIIVPVYNVEKYLGKCVSSILGQRYKNLQIVLVDDGSTDNSAMLCDEYGLLDTRVHVIHKKNGGLSSARNAGLDYVYSKDTFDVTNEYIAFIDSDDYVADDYVSFLCTLLVAEDADVAQCGHYIGYSERRKVDKNANHDLHVLNKIEALESLCYNGIYDVTAWNKLYKATLFVDVRYPEGMIYEDTAISYLIAEKAEKIVVCMESKYYYNQRYTSIANGVSFNPSKYDFITIGDEMADYISQYYPSSKNAVNAKRVYVRLSTLSQMVNCNYYDKSKILEIVTAIKKYSKNIMHNKNVSKRDKIGVVSVQIGFSFYRFLWKLYYKVKRRV